MIDCQHHYCIQSYILHPNCNAIYTHLSVPESNKKINNIRHVHQILTVAREKYAHIMTLLVFC